MKKDSPVERIWNGIYTENPVFVLILGMCPTLATTTSAMNGLGMGLSTTIVLTLSEVLISMLRKIIPDRMRMPAFIVVIASFVTMIDFLMEAYTPSLYDTLGIYIPLIVVNCIIMGRAEAYAGKMAVIPSFFDGIGMGLGFTLALFLLGSVREIIGAGTWLGLTVAPASYVPVNIFVLAPGAFLVLGWLIAIMNKLKIGAGRPDRRKKVDPTEGDGCEACEVCETPDAKPAAKKVQDAKEAAEKAEEKAAAAVAAVKAAEVKPEQADTAEKPAAKTEKGEV